MSRRDRWLAQLRKLDLLQQATNAMRAGESVPREAALWLAESFQAFIDEGGQLAQHLGMTVRRGGRYDTAHARRRIEQRDFYLVLLISETPGPSVAARVRRVADFLHGRGPEPVPQLGRHIREKIRAMGVRMPDEERVSEIYRDRDQIGISGPFSEAEQQRRWLVR